MTESLWPQLRAEQSDSLRRSLSLVAEENPDQRARIDKLSKKTGLPESIVSRNMDGIERKSEVRELDLYEVEKDSPFLAQYLRDRRNAAQAKDDVKNLSFIEKIQRGFDRGLLTDDMGEMGYQQWLQYNPERQAEIEAVSERIRRLSVGEHEEGFTVDFLDPAAEIAGMMLRGVSAATHEAIAGAATGAGIAFAMGQAGPQVVLPEEALTVPAGALSGMGYGMTIGMAEHAFRIETGHAYVEMLDVVGEDGARIDPELAKYGATAVGVINAALEVVGIAAVTAPVREVIKRHTVQNVRRALTNPTTARAVVDFAKRYGTGWAGEVGTEVAQEIVNMEAVELVKQLSEGDFEEMSEDEWNDRIGEIFSKVGRGMAILALPGPSVTLAHDMSAVRKGRSDVRRMADMSQAVQNSKLRERNPEKFRELMQKLGQDTGTDTVYVDSAAAEVFFQQGLDPELAEQPGIQRLIQDTAQSRENGSSDVEIPLEVYATEIVGTSLGEALKNDMHMDPDAFTQNQLGQFDLRKRIEEISEMDAEQFVNESYVYNEVLGQTLDTAKDRAQAERQAALVEVLFQALVQRKGIAAAGETMESLFDRFGLRIDREIDPRVQERMRAVEKIDVLLDKLREGSIPQDQDIFGQSILPFIAEKGGIKDTAGELANMDTDDGRVGRNRISRDDGMDLDYMAELLNEEGYIAERSEQAVLDAIRAELDGDKVYRLGAENVELMSVRDSLVELDQILGEAGVDVQAMSNEEIRQAMDDRVPAGAFSQPRMPAAEEQQFGDLTVSEDVTVKETGETVTIKQSAQRKFEQAMKRRNVINQIRKCVRAAA